MHQDPLKGDILGGPSHVDPSLFSYYGVNNDQFLCAGRAFVVYPRRILSRAGCRSPRKVLMEQTVFVITHTSDIDSDSCLKALPLRPLRYYSS